MTMLRRIYRHSIKQTGWHNTVWTHEYSLHKASMKSLEQRGLVQSISVKDIELPSGEGAGNLNGWYGSTKAYILTQDGLQFVKSNTPILIHDKVLFNGDEHEVVSWDDFYITVELMRCRDGSFGIFVPPQHLQLKDAESVMKG